MPDPDSVIHTFDDQRRKAIVRGWSVGAGSWIAAVIAVWWLKSEASPSSSLADILEFLATGIAFFGGAGVIGYVAYVRADTRAGLLLWLRRFRESYGDRVRFHVPLARACSGMLHPVTIQDSSFRASFFSAIRNGWALALLLPVMWLIGFLVMLFALFTAGIESSGAVLLVLVAWTVGLILLALHYLKRAGVTKVARESARAEARAILDSIGEGRAGGMGLEVLKCDDNTWRDVVAEAIRKAKVVLIDISEPTDNIYWEVSEGLRHLPPNSIIFTVESGKDTDQLFRDVFTHFGSKKRGLSEKWLKEAALTYPAAQAPVGPGRNQQYSALSKQLRREIALRVSTGEPRRAKRRSTSST